MKPMVYTREGQLLGTLSHACRIRCRQVHNDLWTASFCLPLQDPQNDLLSGVYPLVALYDGTRPLGLYRVFGEAEAPMRGQALRRYECEHVLAFLLDERIDEALELGGTWDTRRVLEALLARQSEPRWVLGSCQFSFHFQYLWEAEDLLSALYSVPRCFEARYRWTFDTGKRPWTLNLVRDDEAPVCELRLGRNERSIRRSRDMSALCTRLYCLGSGEGVNRTSIRDAAQNKTGLPYIDSPNIKRYGILARHLIDTSVSNADLLYEKGKALLREMEEPRIGYSVEAADLHRLTGLPADRMEPGRRVRVTDSALGLCFESTILEVEKEDVDGDPLGMKLVLSNKAGDAAKELETLSRRTAITAQYAQGATNLFPLQIMDNADAQHPARLRFFVPESCARINRVLLSYTLSPFRAYSTGNESGGGTILTTLEGGAGMQTSSAGGQSTQTSSGASQSRGTTRTRTLTETVTTSQPVSDGQARDYTGGPVTVLGQAMDRTGAAAGSTGMSGEVNTGLGRNASGAMTRTGEAGQGSTGTALASLSISDAGSHTHGGTGHSHGTYAHSHSVGQARTGTASPRTTTESTGMNSAGSHSHSLSQNSHSHTVYGHTHGMAHWHTLDGHSHSLGGHVHDMSHQHRFPHAHSVQVAVTIPELEVTLEGHTHTVQVPAHTHSVDIPAHSHSVSVPMHSHALVYGIYEGGMAGGVQVRVDGKPIPEEALLDSGGRARTEIDVVPYLSMTGGRITRGAWHVVELVPDRLTRIEADLFVQTFVTSWNGGSY